MIVVIKYYRNLWIKIKKIMLTIKIKSIIINNNIQHINVVKILLNSRRRTALDQLHVNYLPYIKKIKIKIGKVILVYIILNKINNTTNNNNNNSKYHNNK